MPTYRLSLEFEAADDRQAHRLGMAWAGTAAEWDTRNPVVIPVAGELRDRLAEAIRQHHIDDERVDYAGDSVYCVCGELVEDWEAHWSTAALAVVMPELEQLRAEVAGMRDLFEAANELASARTDERDAERQRAEQAEVHRDALIDEVKTLQNDLDEFVEAQKAWLQFRRERDALKAGIAEAVRQIREWMNPDSDGPLFAPDHAAEVDRTLKKYIGEHVIAALTAPETPHALLADVSAHLRALCHAGRHDHMGANLTCAACDLVRRIEALEGPR